MLDNNSSVAELKQAEEKMCDGALTAFRRAVREISRSAKLQAYNKNEEILKYFDGDYQTVSLTLAHRLGRCMQPSVLEAAEAAALRIKDRSPRYQRRHPHPHPHPQNYGVTLYASALG